jgi:hypothetical protein
MLVLMLFACAAQPSTSGPEQPLALPHVESETSIPNPTEIIFVLTKMGFMTQEAQTETAVSPKNDATFTAILATKFAGATQMAETITAMPTETPTPAIPSDSPFCSSADLKTSFDSNGATGNVLLSAIFTNISNTPCYLQAWSQATLADKQGNPLDIDYSYPDISTSEAPYASTEKVGLRPQWTAWFTLIWFDYRTWCGAPVTSNLVIHLTLMNNSEVIDVPTNFHPAVSHCDPPGARTSVSITKLNIVPPQVSTPIITSTP